MKLLRTVQETQHELARVRAQGKRIGFVATMGALHEGHLVLVDRVREETDYVVMSIFVNPTQFNKADDFNRYPRNEEKDAALATGRAVDLLFVPSVEEMYPRGEAGCRIRAGATAVGYEGEFRPGHFDGVVTVVGMLFNILKPDVSAFGEKDFQQIAVIREMVEALHLPVSIRAVETVREPDKLASASRNFRLTDGQRVRARAIPTALFAMRELAEQGEADFEHLIQVGAALLQEARLTIEYLDIIDELTFKPLREPTRQARIVTAVRVDDVRLLDTLKLSRWELE